MIFRARPFSAVCLVALAAASISGCASESASDEGSKVTVLPRATTGPYVSVAVDNHFHDIHPEDDIEIAVDRPFVVKNQGSNLHNVTIVGTDVTKDIRPGRVFRTAPVGVFLVTGETYDVICRFHDSQGMTGRFTVVD